MIQYMMPVDYLRTGMAMWSRTAELQLELMRMSIGIADTWTGGMMKPDPAVMKFFTPTGMTSKARKGAPATPGAVAAVATSSAAARVKPTAEQPARPVAKVVSLESPKPAAKAAVTSEAPQPAKADAATAKPATKRRRAPSKPRTPTGMTEAVAPVAAEAKPAKPAPRRRAAPKAKPAAAAASTAKEPAAKPATRRRAPAKKAADSKPATGIAGDS